MVKDAQGQSVRLLCRTTGLVPTDVGCVERILGFRVDEPTKALIERAAQIQRRKLTDFCMTALTEAAQRTISESETLELSERDRAVFFDALVNPPAPNARLQRAFAEHRRRIAR